MDCGLLLRARGKALHCCGKPGEVARDGVVVVCESYCIVSLELLVVVLVVLCV